MIGRDRARQGEEWLIPFKTIGNVQKMSAFQAFMPGGVTDICNHVTLHPQLPSFSERISSSERTRIAVVGQLLILATSEKH